MNIENKVMQCAVCHVIFKFLFASENLFMSAVEFAVFDEADVLVDANFQS